MDSPSQVLSRRPPTPRPISAREPVEVAIHWFPISGAKEYRGRIESLEDGSRVDAFTARPRPGLVITYRTNLPPGRYLARLYVRIGSKLGGSRWAKIDRTFEVEPRRFGE